MKNSPKFLKEFSKRDPEARKNAAEEIKARRSEYFDEKRALSARQRELLETTSEREKQLKEQLDLLDNLERSIEELSRSRLSEVVNFINIRRLRSEIQIGKKTYDELKAAQDLELSERDSIKESLGKGRPTASSEAEQILEEFYKKQEIAWAEDETATKEEVKELFTEEHLASLSVEDYALLLKRFPSELFTHVTRQGIRDHIGHMYHTAGVGQYSDGFRDLVQDGRLRSSLAIRTIGTEKDKAIAKYLQLDKFSSREEALANLNKILHGSNFDYSDSMAIHFAAEEVADEYYGSERGNEIFVAYPAMQVASQYHYNGSWDRGTRGQWNDQWVWANEERGIDLNAGLVFIPENAKVDRTTGSRYKLDEQGRPLKNDEANASLLNLYQSPDFLDFASQALEVFKKSATRREVERIRNQLTENLEELGIADQRLQEAVFNYHRLRSLIYSVDSHPEDRDEKVQEILDQMLKDAGLYYVEAEDTISSKEYWEQQFSENPEKKPSKIVYYKGSNPTEALNKWKQEHGLNKYAIDSSVDLTERQVQKDSSEAMSGSDRFESIARDIINRRYPPPLPDAIEPPPLPDTLTEPPPLPGESFRSVA